MNEKTEVPRKCGHLASLPSVNGLSALNSVICYPRRGGYDVRFLIMSNHSFMAFAYLNWSNVAAHTLRSLVMGQPRQVVGNLP